MPHARALRKKIQAWLNAKPPYPRGVTQPPQRLRRQVKRCAMPNALPITQRRLLPQVRRNCRPRKRNWPRLKHGYGARAKPMRH